MEKKRQLRRYSLQDPEYLYLSASAEALQDALATLPPLNGTRVLEIGSGNQWMKRHIEQEGGSYTGIDITRAVKPGAVMAAERLGIRSESHDVAISVAVLEHVEEPVKVMEEAYRVLKGGGHLIVQIPGFYPYHPNPHDFWRWTHTGIEKLVNDTGFSTIATFPSGSSVVTYLTILIQSISLLLTRIRIISWTRMALIPLCNLFGRLLAKYPLQKTGFREPGNLIMSYALVAQKPSRK